MNEKRKALLEQITAKGADLDAIFAKGADASEEDLARAKELDAELITMDAEAKKLDEVDAIALRQKSRNEWMNAPTGHLAVATPEGGKVYATARRSTGLKGLAYIEGGEELAHDMGAWFLTAFGAPGYFEKSRKYCRDHGLEVKAAGEGSALTGGVLVPTGLDTGIIQLIERYGVARRRWGYKRMTEDVRNVPRRVSGLTAYAVSEGATITDSTKAWDMVELVARKWGVLTYISSELSEDAVIDVGADVADEIAQAFAYGEDNAAINGDGSATYNNTVGLDTLFKKRVTDAGGTFSTDAHKLYAAGIRGATGNTWASVVLTDMEALQGALPVFADTPNKAWFCHKAFYHAVMRRLVLSAGGATAAEIADASVNPRFLGDPVEFMQVMPSATAANQIPVYYGDMALAAKFGDRRRIAIATSEHVNFASDQVAIRGLERISIVNHDIGNGDSSAGNRVVGPVVALAILN